MVAAVYPSPSVEKQIWSERFGSYADVHRNQGALTGSPVVSRGNLHLDGATQYGAWAIPPALLAHEEISFECRFTPDFNWDEDVSRYLYDCDASGRYWVWKSNSGSGYVLGLGLGGTGMPSVASSIYSPYWKVGEENVLIVSSVSGATNVWLNGHHILANAATAWTPKYPTELYIGASVGGGNRFDGIIHSLTIRSRLLSALDVAAIQNNSLYTYPSRAQLYCDFSRVVIDGSNDYAIDLSRFGRTVLLGDGAGTGTPSFQNPGLLFDGVNDYLTLPSDPTGTFTVAWKRANEDTVFESNLTTWNLLKAAGSFSGLLKYLAYWDTALSPIQQDDLELLWRGNR